MEETPKKYDNVYSTQDAVPEMCPLCLDPVQTADTDDVEFVCSNLACNWRGKVELTKFAPVSWNINDVLDMRDNLELAPEWTEKQAVEFLDEYGRYIQERLIIIGNEILEDLLRYKK